MSGTWHLVVVKDTPGQKCLGLIALGMIWGNREWMWIVMVIEGKYQEEKGTYLIFELEVTYRY